MPLEFEAGEEDGVMRRFVQTGTADTPSFEDVAALLIGTDHPRPFLAIPAVSSSSSRFDSFIRARSSIAGWKEAPVVRRCRLLGSFAPATIEFMNGIGGDNGSRTNRPPEGRPVPVGDTITRMFVRAAAGA